MRFHFLSPQVLHGGVAKFTNKSALAVVIAKERGGHVSIAFELCEFALHSVPLSTITMANKPTVKAYRGDAKTLLAFNLSKAASKNLAGFTIHCEPKGKAGYFLLNFLRFENPSDHAQDPKLPSNSSINAPIQKFRWLHVPGSSHQGLKPFFGTYRYTVTPRYFDNDGSMLPLDEALSTSVETEVAPFEKKGLQLGFTRGYMQSQAFVHHFGKKAVVRPKGATLLSDTSVIAGSNAKGEKYTYAEQYEWLGYTARERIFAVLNEVLADKKLSLDVFAYDLNEPDVCALLLKLAKQGRVRVILDNATLHHSTTKDVPEDEFEQLFEKAQKGAAAILRGKFGRFSHDKVLIVSRDGKATKVLTGSTNFSVTGMYVNSNHVVVFNDAVVAKKYAEVFEAAWAGDVKRASFLKSALSKQSFSFESTKTPPTEISFAPHSDEVAEQGLDAIAERVEKESNTKNGSVFFAVMDIGTGSGPVFPALKKLHSDQDVFSFGITDTTDGLKLYAPGQRTGLLVTGKPTATILPPPFDQVPGVGLGHQVHHKFVVCGFNGKDPTLYCGSSNLALGGECQNGDNLLTIRDGDVATAFVIEALALVDHFNFLNRCSSANKSKKATAAPSDKSDAAVIAGFFLRSDQSWTKGYFDPDDLHCVDRQLFGG